LEENQPPLADLPSAHSTAENSREEEIGEEVQQVKTNTAVDSEAEQARVKAKRRRLNLSETSSTDSKEEEQMDTGNSNAQSPMKSQPLNISHLASRPSAPSGGVSRLGVFALGNDPESDEDEELRFVL